MHACIAHPTARRCGALWCAIGRAVVRAAVRYGVAYYAKSKKCNYIQGAARCGEGTALKRKNPFNPFTFFLICKLLNFDK